MFWKDMNLVDVLVVIALRITPCATQVQLKFYQKTPVLNIVNNTAGNCVDNNKMKFLSSALWIPFYAY